MKSCKWKKGEKQPQDHSDDVDPPSLTLLKIMLIPDDWTLFNVHLHSNAERNEQSHDLTCQSPVLLWNVSKHSSIFY